MPAAQYSHPIEMNTSLIEMHYNRGRPMSDLALHAAQYFRPRKMHNALMQSQYYHERSTGGAKRKAVEAADKASGATVSTSPQKNGSATDNTDTRPAKRQKVSTPSLPTVPITLSSSVEAMLARQVLKAKPMIFRWTRPVPARGGDATATADDTNKAKAVGGVGLMFSSGAIKAMNKEDGGAAPAPLQMSTKETSSRVRRAVEAPTKGPTTSFASPPKYRK